MWIDGDGGSAGGDSGGSADAGASRGRAGLGREDIRHSDHQDELFTPARAQEGERLYAGRYKTPDDLEKGYENLRKFQGENGKWTRETLEGYMREQGWRSSPKAPDEYTGLDEYMQELGLNHEDKEGKERLIQYWKSRGRRIEDASWDLDFFANEAKVGRDAVLNDVRQELKDAGILWNREEVAAGLQKAWGDQWEARGEATLNFMQANLPGLLPALRRREWGWHVMDRIREIRSGDQPLRQGGARPDQAIRLAERRQEIRESEAFNTPTHLRHAEAVAEWKALCSQLGQMDEKKGR